MTSNDLLAHLGIYLEPGFLTPDECAGLIELVESRSTHPAGVYDSEGGGRVDRNQRQVSEASGLKDELDWLTRRFDQRRESLAKRFDENLSRVDRPTLLVYDPGDFFLPHRDNGTREGTGRHPETQSRKVTGIVFLNTQGDHPGQGDYEGGSLTFYGLMRFPAAENHGLPVRADAGLLVAFRAGERHGVTELVRGRRYCALTWYR